MKYLIPQPLVPLIQRARYLPYLVVYALTCWVKPIQEKSVVLISGNGSRLQGNLAWIRDHMPQSSFQVSEFFPAGSSSRPRRIIDRCRLMSAVAQAQYVVMDDYLHLIHVLRIRSGVRVIQVWHAMGAMKKMGFSRVGRASNAPPRTSLLHRNYTDVIVSSPAMAPHYAEAFRTSIDKVHPLGAPRSDFFFDADAQELVRQELSAKVPALKDRRVVLFAPTYRDTAAHGCDYPSEFLDLDRVGETLEDQDLFVLKFHPFVRRVWQIPEAHRDKIIDLSTYPEFNHLLSVADLLVSDYSSAIFDCGLLRKPVVYYVPDMDTYDGARGFYYPFDQYVYGPVATTFDALLDNLSTVELDESRHQEFHDLFLQGCDGNATQRFFDQMLQPTLPQQNQRGER